MKIRIFAALLALFAASRAFADPTPLFMKIDRTVDPSPICANRLSTQTTCHTIGYMSSGGVYSINNAVLTGTPVSTTPSAGNSSTRIATTAFVAGELTSKANIDSPNFTGTPTAPTALAGTSSTQIANTSFVATSFAPKASPTFTGTVTINPTAASTQKGINISQSGPASGSSAGAVELNKIEATWRNTLTGAGAPGTPTCACVALFQVSLNVGGSNFDGVEAYGGSFGVVHNVADTSYSDKVGLSMGVASSASSNGNIYGGSAGATNTSTSSSREHIGFEIDSTFESGATVPHRSGLSIGTFSNGQASTFDAAIGIFASGTVGTKGFKTLIGLKSAGGTLNPGIDPTGKLFMSESAFTLAKGFDFTNGTFTSHVIDLAGATVSGNIINSSSAILSGTGNLTVSTMRTFAAAPTVSAGQVGYGSTTAAVANCGGAATACLVINVAGTTRYIPYY